VRGGSRLAALVPLYMVVATAIGFVDFRARAHPAIAYEKYTPGVVANTEEPPGKYRVLAPFTYEGLVEVTGLKRDVAWVIFRWLSALAGLLATHWMLTAWFAARHALTGTLLSSLLLLLTFTNSWPHPDHLVEWALSAAAVGALVRGRDGLFAVFLVVAALNRETSAFLWLLFLVARPWSGPHAVRAGLLGAAWAAIYVGLRWWRGVEWYDPWQATRNLEFLRLLPDAYDPYFRAYAWFGVILAGPILWMGWRSWPDQPRLAKSALLVVIPAFFVTAFCFSSIIETRIFTPLVPLLAVVVMFALHGADNTAAGP
jgi:hypothetical protein